MTRVLLDVDTGIDDALALLYAACEPRLELVGVSAVVGNVPVEVAARNSAAVLAVAGAASVPVVVGAAVTAGGRGARRGPTNHGVDGLGGVSVPLGSAVGSSLDLPGPYVIAACGPLTNIARLLGHPGPDRVVLVGGELTPEDEPEFNVGHDSISAAVVLAVDVSLTVYPIDVFETVAVPASLVSRLRRAPGAAARLAGELLAVRRSHLLGDAAAVVLLAHPGLFTTERLAMAVVGHRLVPDPAGRVVEVVVAADVEAVVAAYVGCLLAAG